MTSKSRSQLPDMKQGGARLEEIMHRAYDSFDIHLTSIQLLYSRVGKYIVHYVLFILLKSLIRCLSSFSEDLHSKYVRASIFFN